MHYYHALFSFAMFAWVLVTCMDQAAVYMYLLHLYSNVPTSIADQSLNVTGNVLLCTLLFSKGVDSQEGHYGMSCVFLHCWICKLP